MSSLTLSQKHILQAATRGPFKQFLRGYAKLSTLLYEKDHPSKNSPYQFEKEVYGILESEFGKDRTWRGDDLGLVYFTEQSKSDKAYIKCSEDVNSSLVVSVLKKPNVKTNQSGSFQESLGGINLHYGQERKPQVSMIFTDHQTFTESSKGVLVASYHMLAEPFFIVCLEGTEKNTEDKKKSTHGGMKISKIVVPDKFVENFIPKELKDYPREHLKCDGKEPTKHLWPSPDTLEKRFRERFGMIKH